MLAKSAILTAKAAEAIERIATQDGGRRIINRKHCYAVVARETGLTERQVRALHNGEAVNPSWDCMASLINAMNAVDPDFFAEQIGGLYATNGSRKEIIADS